MPHARTGPLPLPDLQTGRKDEAGDFALITGFGPFPRVPCNPSAEIARIVAQDRRWRRLGWRIEAGIFPTRYGIVAETIARLAAQTPPRFVVMLGVAARARRLRVEMVAQNRVSGVHRDAGMARPGAAVIAPAAGAIRRGRHAGPVLVRALRRAGVPAEPSFSAGRYVCNFAYWHMLGAFPAPTEIVFVHVPMPQAPWRRRDPRPDRARMAHALTWLVAAMIARARLSQRAPAPGGAGRIPPRSSW